MVQSVLTFLFGLISLIFVSTTLIYRHKFQVLQSEVNANRRVRRDIMFDLSEQKDYFPLYTQLSSKLIQQVCNQQRRIHKNRTKKRPAFKKHTKCAPITSIVQESVWNRPFTVGSASKCNQNWIITEFASGYALFEYQDKSHPTSIYTLPEAFEGTDHTTYCDLNGNNYFIYFSSNPSSIIKFDLRTQKYIRTPIIASKDPLYNGSSSVDLEVDSEWLYVIYRLQKNLAVTKFALKNLKQAGNWILNDERLVNATNIFISCGILYSTNYINGKQRLESVYDFNANVYLFPDSSILEWSSNGRDLENLHYESNSDNLSVFDNGSIYSLTIYRNIK